jgi:hypothetical protein
MSKFFREPAFLGLLRFWLESQSGRDLPDWKDDLSLVPQDILPNLIIEIRNPDPIYQFVGAACAQWWGEDVTGRHIYGEVLLSVYGRYIRSLEEETLARHAPIFSEAIFELGSDMLMTGRLFAPFTHHGSAEPSVIFGLQLFSGPPVHLADVSRAGFTSEFQRQMIVAVPGLLARLEKASRYHKLSRQMHQSDLAGTLAGVAREAIGEAMIPLPTFDSGSYAPG